MQHYGKTPDGTQIILSRFDGGVEVTPSVDPTREHPILFLDVETTGLEPGQDKVIELAAALVDVNVDDGRVVRHHRTVSWLEDPGFPLPPIIVDITGLTDDDVRGHTLPEDDIRTLFKETKVVVTHNAAFDRAFCVARFPWLAGKGMPMWECSWQGIDWKGTHGCKHADLETLALYHGFFYGAHRATIDVEAMVKLLGMSPAEGERRYLCELIADIRKPYCLIAASNAPFEAKGKLKYRSYQWSPEDKHWFRAMPYERLGEEWTWVQGLCAEFRGGRPIMASLPRSKRFDRTFKPKWSAEQIQTPEGAP